MDKLQDLTKVGPCREYYNRQYGRRSGSEERMLHYPQTVSYIDNQKSRCDLTNKKRLFPNSRSRSRSKNRSKSKDRHYYKPNNGTVYSSNFINKVTENENCIVEGVEKLLRKRSRSKVCDEFGNLVNKIDYAIYDGEEFQQEKSDTKSLFQRVDERDDSMGKTTVISLNTPPRKHKRQSSVPHVKTKQYYANDLDQQSLLENNWVKKQMTTQDDENDTMPKSRNTTTNENLTNAEPVLIKNKPTKLKKGISEMTQNLINGSEACPKNTAENKTVGSRLMSIGDIKCVNVANDELPLEQKSHKRLQSDRDKHESPCESKRDKMKSPRKAVVKMDNLGDIVREIPVKRPDTTTNEEQPQQPIESLLDSNSNSSEDIKNDSSVGSDEHVHIVSKTKRERRRRRKKYKKNKHGEKTIFQLTNPNPSVPVEQTSLRVTSDENPEYKNGKKRSKRHREKRYSPESVDSDDSGSGEEISHRKEGQGSHRSKSDSSVCESITVTGQKRKRCKNTSNNTFTIVGNFFRNNRTQSEGRGLFNMFSQTVGNCLTSIANNHGRYHFPSRKHLYVPDIGLGSNWMKTNDGEQYFPKLNARKTNPCNSIDITSGLRVDDPRCKEVRIKHTVLECEDVESEGMVAEGGKVKVIDIDRPFDCRESRACRRKSKEHHDAFVPIKSRKTRREQMMSIRSPPSRHITSPSRHTVVDDNDAADTASYLNESSAQNDYYDSLDDKPSLVECSAVRPQSHDGRKRDPPHTQRKSRTRHTDTQQPEVETLLNDTVNKLIESRHEKRESSRGVNKQRQNTTVLYRHRDRSNSRKEVATYTKEDRLSSGHYNHDQFRDAMTSNQDTEASTAESTCDASIQSSNQTDTCSRHVHRNSHKRDRQVKVFGQGKVSPPWDDHDTKCGRRPDRNENWDSQDDADSLRVSNISRSNRRSLPKQLLSDDSDSIGYDKRISAGSALMVDDLGFVFECIDVKHKHNTRKTARYEKCRLENERYGKRSVCSSQSINTYRHSRSVSAIHDRSPVYSPTSDWCEAQRNCVRLAEAEEKRIQTRMSSSEKNHSDHYEHGDGSGPKIQLNTYTTNDHKLRFHGIPDQNNHDQSSSLDNMKTSSTQSVVANNSSSGDDSNIPDNKSIYNDLLELKKDVDRLSGLSESLLSRRHENTLQTPNHRGALDNTLPNHERRCHHTGESPLSPSMASVNIYRSNRRVKTEAETQIVNSYTDNSTKATTVGIFRGNVKVFTTPGGSEWHKQEADKVYPEQADTMQFVEMYDRKRTLVRSSDKDNVTTVSSHSKHTINGNEVIEETKTMMVKNKKQILKQSNHFSDDVLDDNRSASSLQRNSIGRRSGCDERAREIHNSVSLSRYSQAQLTKKENEQFNQSKYVGIDTGSDWSESNALHPTDFIDTFDQMITPEQPVRVTNKEIGYSKTFIEGCMSRLSETYPANNKLSTQLFKKPPIHSNIKQRRSSQCCEVLGEKEQLNSIPNYSCRESTGTISIRPNSKRADEKKYFQKSASDLDINLDVNDVAHEFSEISDTLSQNQNSSLFTPINLTNFKCDVFYPQLAYNCSLSRHLTKLDISSKQILPKYGLDRVILKDIVRNPKPTHSDVLVNSEKCLTREPGSDVDSSISAFSSDCGDGLEKLNGGSNRFLMFSNNMESWQAWSQSWIGKFRPGLCETNSALQNNTQNAIVNSRSCTHSSKLHKQPNEQCGSRPTLGTASFQRTKSAPRLGRANDKVFKPKRRSSKALKSKQPEREPAFTHRRTLTSGEQTNEESTWDNSQITTVESNTSTSCGQDIYSDIDTTLHETNSDVFRIATPRHVEEFSADPPTMTLYSRNVRHDDSMPSTTADVQMLQKSQSKQVDSLNTFKSLNNQCNTHDELHSSKLFLSSASGNEIDSNLFYSVSENTSPIRSSKRSMLGSIGNNRSNRSLNHRRVKTIQNTEGCDTTDVASDARCADNSLTVFVVTQKSPKHIQSYTEQNSLTLNKCSNNQSMPATAVYISDEKSPVARKVEIDDSLCSNVTENNSNILDAHPKRTLLDGKLKIVYNEESNKWVSGSKQNLGFKDNLTKLNDMQVAKCRSITRQHSNTNYGYDSAPGRIQSYSNTSGKDSVFYSWFKERVCKDLSFYTDSQTKISQEFCGLSLVPKNSKKTMNGNDKRSEHESSASESSINLSRKLRKRRKVKHAPCQNHKRHRRSSNNISSSIPRRSQSEREPSQSDKESTCGINEHMNSNITEVVNEQYTELVDQDISKYNPKSFLANSFSSMIGIGRLVNKMGSYSPKCPKQVSPKKDRHCDSPREILEPIIEESQSNQNSDHGSTSPECFKHYSTRNTVFGISEEEKNVTSNRVEYPDVLNANRSNVQNGSNKLGEIYRSEGSTTDCNKFTPRVYLSNFNSVGYSNDVDPKLSICQDCSNKVEKRCLTELSAPGVAQVTTGTDLKISNGEDDENDVNPTCSSGQNGNELKHVGSAEYLVADSDSLALRKPTVPIESNDNEDNIYSKLPYLYENIGFKSMFMRNEIHKYPTGNTQEYDSLAPFSDRYASDHRYYNPHTNYPGAGFQCGEQMQYRSLARNDGHAYSNTYSSNTHRGSNCSSRSSDNYYTHFVKSAHPDPRHKCSGMSANRSTCCNSKSLRKGKSNKNNNFCNNDLIQMNMNQNSNNGEESDDPPEKYASFLSSSGKSKTPSESDYKWGHASCSIKDGKVPQASGKSKQFLLNTSKVPRYNTCNPHASSNMRDEYCDEYSMSNTFALCAGKNINGSGNMVGSLPHYGQVCQSLGYPVSAEELRMSGNGNLTPPGDDVCEIDALSDTLLCSGFEASGGRMEIDATCNHPSTSSRYIGDGSYCVPRDVSRDDIRMKLSPCCQGSDTYRKHADQSRSSFKEGHCFGHNYSDTFQKIKDNYMVGSQTCVAVPSTQGMEIRRSFCGQGDTNPKRGFTEWYVTEERVGDLEIPQTRRELSASPRLDPQHLDKTEPSSDESVESMESFNTSTCSSNCSVREIQERHVNVSGDECGSKESSEYEFDNVERIDDVEQGSDADDDEWEDDTDDEADGSDSQCCNPRYAAMRHRDTRNAVKDMTALSNLKSAICQNCGNEAQDLTHNKHDSMMDVDHGGVLRTSLVKSKEKGDSQHEETTNKEHQSKAHSQQRYEEKEQFPKPRSKTKSLSKKFSFDHIKVPSIDKERVRFACSEKGEWAEIGRGSYGCVYLGLLDGSVEVAIKDFYESSSWDLVIHEARMLLFLQETGITPAFYGLRRRFNETKDPSEYCIIMEYFGDGRTLFNVMSDKILLAPEEWLDVVGQLVAGLRLIHSKQVLINDLKADNILIDLSSGRKTIRYIDVGMATYKQGLTFQLPSDQMNKYNFLAPEVREGAHTSTKSDIYSLGYMLDQIMRLAGPALTGLDKLVARCLDKNPANRPDIDEIVSQVHWYIVTKSHTRDVSPRAQVFSCNSV